VPPKILLKTPTVCQVEGLTSFQDLNQALTYTDRRVEFELNKVRQSLRKYQTTLRSYMESKLGTSGYNRLITTQSARVKELESQRKQTLLTRLPDGTVEFPSGLAERVAGVLGIKLDLTPAFALPESENIPWAKVPPQARPYQDEALEAMVSAAGKGPVAISLPTGSGKSLIAANLLKNYGLPALVMAPSTSIATQLVEDLTRFFGSKYVGLFGGGKKQSDKKFVVGIDDSLTRVEPGSKHWINLCNRSVFIGDESHLVAADTLKTVCLGLAGSSPYRFFVSATQLRTDGLDMVLEGIIGPIVYRKALKELVNEGWLARPKFKMIRMNTNKPQFQSPDANKMTREHLYYSSQVNQLAAKIVNQYVQNQKPVLILVQEVEQFAHLAKHLQGRVGFAHGPLSKDNQETVPVEHRQSDPTALVAEFNAGDLPILVGTSCVSTGTDVRAAEAVVYLMGGASEIKVAQAVGRGTRGGPKGVKVLNPWTGVQKLDCQFIDFCVEGGGDPDRFPTSRHAQARVDVYRDLMGSDAVEFINYSNGSAF
jgi:superfamily II DNA or RNA helicase